MKISSVLLICGWLAIIAARVKDDDGKGLVITAICLWVIAIFAAIGGN